MYADLVQGVNGGNGGTSDMGLEFYEPSQSPFLPQYSCGRNSPYGEQTLLLLQSLAEQKGLHCGRYADLYHSSYSSKDFDGYTNASTVAFLRNYSRGLKPPATGAEDQQADTVARLAPVVAAFAGRSPTSARVVNTEYEEIRRRHNRCGGADAMARPISSSHTFITVSLIGIEFWILWRESMRRFVPEPQLRSKYRSCVTSSVAVLLLPGPAITRGPAPPAAGGGGDPGDTEHPSSCRLGLRWCGCVGASDAGGCRSGTGCQGNSAGAQEPPGTARKGSTKYVASRVAVGAVLCQRDVVHLSSDKQFCCDLLCCHVHVLPASSHW